MNPLGDNEKHRVHALQQYLLNDAKGQEAFKDLTIIAASVCNTENAYITLIDDERLHFLASKQFVLSDIDQTLSFCRITIQSNQIHEVTDALEDEIFKHNPYVIGEPYVRYYCGAPLIDEGTGDKLGALCVIDTKTRMLSDSQKTSLVLLAKQVMNGFKLSRRERELELEHVAMEEVIVERTETLMDTNHWLSKIIDLVPHPIFLKDKTGKYLLANGAQGKLFGKDSSELLGKTDVDFVFNKAEYKVIKESDDATVESREIVILPEQVITLGERKYYLHTSKIPVISPVDGELRILGVSVDLTEVRFLQMEYDQSMEAFQKLVEISPDAIYIQSKSGDILFANPSGVKLLGATDMNDLLGKSVMQFIHPDSLNEVENRIGNSASLNGKISEQKAITLTGEIIDIEVVSVSFIYNGIDAEQVIVRDVSDRIKARQALYQSREEFRTLTDNSTDIIARINTDLTFVYINKAITAITGKQLDYYSGKTAKEAGFEEHLCTGIEYIVEKTVAIGKATSLYFENPELVDKPFRYAHVICVPEFDSSKNVISVLCTVQDVTELKENEKQLIQTSKDLDRFVYSASHELRAPLKSILGLANLMRHEIEHENYTELNEYNSRIERSVKRLDETVQGIIDYSRNARIDVAREVISFDSIISNVLENLSSLSNFSHIQFSTEILLNNTFYSDSRRIKIILSNIISNSIKYADLSKEQSFVKLSIQDNSYGCDVIIRDNGIGIEPKYIQHIYDMFFRATSNNEGDGLGLYIVKETIDKLHGNITVESVLTEGSTFKIHFPNL
ncbi:PAS domain S-box protein [Cytophaga aurantiaca]|uniref:sensor histidine kinase n=1 Tax=Cytophaga aurantiaca TaxID=29530 RepID=UPI000376B487|nr:PAS domain S-box protein [Cytophaga aurantiaca]